MNKNVIDHNRNVLSMYQIGDRFEYEDQYGVWFGVLEEFSLNCLEEIVLGLRMIAPVGERQRALRYLNPSNSMFKLTKLN